MYIFSSGSLLTSYLRDLNKFSLVHAAAVMLLICSVQLQGRFGPDKVKLDSVAMEYGKYALEKVSLVSVLDFHRKDEIY